MPMCTCDRAAFHLATSGRVRAVVGFHPSLGVGKMYGEASESELAARVKCATMLLPAANDPDNVKPGGSILADIAANGFESVSHECKCKTLLVHCTCVVWRRQPHCARAMMLMRRSRGAAARLFSSRRPYGARCLTGRQAGAGHVDRLLEEARVGRRDLRWNGLGGSAVMPTED